MDINWQRKKPQSVAEGLYGYDYNLEVQCGQRVASLAISVLQ